MPICSYLVTAITNKSDLLAQKLSTLPYAESYPSDDQSMFIVVTESDSSQEEIQYQKEIAAMPEVQCITLTYANEETLS